MKDKCIYCDSEEAFTDMELFSGALDSILCDECKEMREICRDMWFHRRGLIYQ